MLFYPLSTGQPLNLTLGISNFLAAIQVNAVTIIPAAIFLSSAPVYPKHDSASVTAHSSGTFLAQLNVVNFHLFVDRYA